jgi:hypothetical protein
VLLQNGVHVMFGANLNRVDVQGGREVAGAPLQAPLPPGVHRPVAVKPQAAVPHLQVGCAAAFRGFSRS